jgi:hypothetical protein
MIVILWFVLGAAFFYFWVTGRWIPAVLALAASFGPLSEDHFQPAVLYLLPIVAVLPLMVRKLVFKPRAPSQGAAVELRAFWPFPGFNKRF